MGSNGVQETAQISSGKSRVLRSWVSDVRAWKMQVGYGLRDLKRVVRAQVEQRQSAATQAHHELTRAHRAGDDVPASQTRVSRVLRVPARAERAESVQSRIVLE